ncbi:MAG: nitrate reductase cytochrome c-type subunit [Burkholderiales bacterium]|jgi:cytochrome c-type protein NapB|nr:nitrate reductase cytochrome c-type subunit [Burkholderiales bacterium]
MKRLTLIVVSSLIVGLVACATQSIPDSQIGLSKASVFETQTPTPYALDGKGAGGAAEAAYGVPPLIPHEIASYQTSRENNMCIACHDRPGQTKKVGDPNDPQPIPSSHYVSAKPGEKLRVSGANYHCELCHAPAANVPDLVKNTGPKPKR